MRLSGATCCVPRHPLRYYCVTRDLLLLRLRHTRIATCGQWRVKRMVREGTRLLPNRFATRRVTVYVVWPSARIRNSSEIRDSRDFARWCVSRKGRSVLTMPICGRTGDTPECFV
eukprot:2262577-Pyramimonas_sp.AAC.1